MSLKWICSFKLFAFGGKGGVGKTTLSSAFALALSRENFRVLLVSVDPAHSLSDLFGLEPSSEVRKAGEGLSLLEIDPKKEIRKHVSVALQTAERLLSPEVLEHLREMISWMEESPEMEETASLEALIRCVIENYERFDKFVIDTAPTGHTLRMLKSVHTLGRWLEEVIRRREEVSRLKLAGRGGTEDSQLLTLLKTRRERHKKFLEILKEESLFIPVTIPEKLPLEETKRLMNDLKSLHFKVGFLLVNKVLPSSGDPFLLKRKCVQDVYREELFRTFPSVPIVELPMLDKDVDTLRDLETLGNLILENVKQKKMSIR